MLKKIASAYNRNDEIPNINLAEELCKSEDKLGIKEVVSGLYCSDKRIANDCIKVLYEIGERKPYLIAEYWYEFIKLLNSTNNRLVWGAMTALTHIVELAGDEIYRNLNIILEAYSQGSVITVDNSVTVLAKLCNVNITYAQHLFPKLLGHLRICRPKEVAQHAERIGICVNKNNVAEFLAVLNKRKEDVSAAQLRRINKLEEFLVKNCVINN